MKLGRLQIGLALLRLSAGVFFLIWSADKLVNPGHAQNVFSHFYFLSISPSIVIAIGVAQTVVVLAFMAGLLKTWTYGAVLAMHTVSVVSTWKQLLTPYSEESPAILFWAAVPLLAALVLLWLARDEDRWLTLPSRR